MSKITVIGAGLAGCEAAWAAASKGVEVDLIEQKPTYKSAAHQSENFAELVCSNSLKAMRANSAAGMLKDEMTRFRSICVEAAYKTQVAAGGALAVNRDKFSEYITQKIKNHPKVNVIERMQTEIPDGIVIIATGPLTEGEFAKNLTKLTGDYLSFYDAAAPIITAESVDTTKTFTASRYDRGDADYINCPMNKAEYESFYEALVSAETAPVSKEDECGFYEGCMPVEVLAKRGIDSVRYGTMKPVGLKNPYTGHRPWANVQLRKEDENGTLYNLVGFQTNLKFGEQKRVFSLIPGLENAEFIRYGVMHRNTFINSPKLLNNDYSLKTNPNIYFAGQITGVEGYMESAQSGILAGLNAVRKIFGKEKILLPETTMMGTFQKYISSWQTKDYQPMGANIGILPPITEKIKCKADRYMAFYERGAKAFDEYLQNLGEI